jgi:hypothetical protein
MVMHPSFASDVEAAIAAQLSRLAPRPHTLADTGLSQAFVADLVAKHLFAGGVLHLQQLVQRLALSGKILEPILHFMRQEARLEVLGPADGTSALRYRLTDRGRSSALDAMLQSGYIGPAPIPLHDYAKVVRAQTVHDRAITKSAMQAAFQGIVLEEGLLDRLGPSLNSGRAIFVYGPAGSGKTYIVQKLKRLFHERTLIPHAIAVNETVIGVFDPVIHCALDPSEGSEGVKLDAGHDPRYVCCERPVIIVGGELTIDMLEVHFDAAKREYRAPLQLKANNGMLMIDDMGRQKVEPAAIFNRWIVPMEEKKDYLSLGAGRHFSVPFDLVLIFSTNMHPLDLADEAFLRRIGYKIEFDYLSKDQYRRIWRDVCADYGVLFDPEVLEFVLTELHERESVGLLPCHPRDLLGIAVDRVTYLGEPRRVTTNELRWAWRNYFVSLNRGKSGGGRFGTDT